MKVMKASNKTNKLNKFKLKVKFSKSVTHKRSHLFVRSKPPMKLLLVEETRKSVSGTLKEKKYHSISQSNQK